MATSNSGNRNSRRIWMVLLVLLLLGACGFTSVLAAAGGLKIVLPGLAGGGIDARVVSVKSAANGQMEIAIQIERGTGEQGGYYAEVNGRRYSCTASEQDAAILLCIGSAFAQGSTVELRLFNKRAEAVIGTTIALLETSGQNERAIDLQVEADTGKSVVTPGSDQATISLNGESQGSKFSILFLLRSLFADGLDINIDAHANVNGGARTDVEADANFNAQTDNTGIRSDIEADLELENAPASACLFGILCLEVDAYADGTSK
jgi:hypothetical protein